MTDTMNRPTIAELEAILQEKGVQIDIRPNGEVLVCDKTQVRIAELEAQLKEKVWDNKPWDWGFVVVVNQLETNMNALLKKNAELEAALTDALYAWGLVQPMAWDYIVNISGGPLDTEKRNYDEAQERIQRARLALPKAQEATNATT